MIINRGVFRKTHINSTEWDFVEVNGNTYLQCYKGVSTNVVFPKGDNIYIGDPNSGDFYWNTNSDIIEHVDFSNLKWVNSRNIYTRLPKANVRTIKGLHDDIPSVRHLCDSFQALDLIELPKNLRSMNAAFAESSVRKPAVAPDTVETMQNTYYNCKLLSKPGNIPRNVKVLHRTFESSGVTRGADLRGTTVKCLNQTYRSCILLTDTNCFNNGLEVMHFTFFGCFSLTKIAPLPSTLKVMSGTFASCKRIEKQPVIPDSVIDMNSTFRGCTNLKYADTLPKSALSVSHTYAECLNLVKGADIPDSVISAEGTYKGCTRIRRGVKLGHSVIIADNLYENCHLLVIAPDFPSNVKSAMCAFANCYRLVKAPALGNLEYIDGMFTECISMQEAPIIPETVKSAKHLFKGCKSLTGNIVVLSKNITNALDMFDTIDKSPLPKKLYVYENSKTYESLVAAGIATNPEKYNLTILPLEKEEN